jgi:hypothetical protein
VQHSAECGALELRRIRLLGVRSHTSNSSTVPSRSIRRSGCHPASGGRSSAGGAARSFLKLAPDGKTSRLFLAVQTWKNFVITKEENGKRYVIGGGRRVVASGAARSRNRRRG